MSKAYCEECFVDREFERIYLNEKVTIRGVELTVNHEYDKCKSCNELFEPHEDYDKNIKNDYIAYRQKMGFMQPEEIKSIRKKYEMTIRQFAAIIGIGFSTLSNIENGVLQNSYQDALFRLAKTPTAFYTLVKDKKDYISENVEDVIETLEIICLHEEPSLEAAKTGIYKKISFIADINASNIRRLNDLEYEIKSYKSNDSPVDSYTEEESSTWKTTISNTFQLN